MAAPEGDTSATGHMGEQTPMETNDGGRAQFGPPLSTDLETHTTPESEVAMPGSYFGLVRRLVEACPRLDVVKRSACIEGARMAFARCKMWWAKMNAVEVARGPPEGKEHRTPERYFADVLEGSRLAAVQCGQNIIFE